MTVANCPPRARLRREDFFDGCDGVAEGPIVRIAIELAGFDENGVAPGLLNLCLLGGEPTRTRIEYRFRPASRSTRSGLDSVDGYHLDSTAGRLSGTRRRGVHPPAPAGSPVSASLTSSYQRLPGPMR